MAVSLDVSMLHSTGRTARYRAPRFKRRSVSGGEWAELDVKDPGRTPLDMAMGLVAGAGSAFSFSGSRACRADPQAVGRFLREINRAQRIRPVGAVCRPRTILI
jgi:hypothetical protein